MKNIYILVLFLILLVFSCKKDDPVGIPYENPISVVEYDPIIQTFPIKYKAKLIDGKLPYPHHNPENWAQIDYENSFESLFVVNNFGLIQGSEEPKSLYFHDGLDIVLKNGTPIFAVNDGIVRAEVGGNEYYRTLIVEDLTSLDYGWAYTHINFFDVKAGDTIQQGQYLGRVNFKGVEHIHLTRFKYRERGKWNDYSDLINIYPDNYFVMNDDVPPFINKPFYFFKNQSNISFENGEIDTVLGMVDIVVSMRDSSSFSGSSRLWGERFGDRLAVNIIDYRILKDGQEVKAYRSFDFTKIGFYYYKTQWEEVLFVFKQRSVFEEPPFPFSGYASYYVITNADQEMDGLILNADHGINAWNTLEKNDSDAFVFPNGLYEVEVTAWDGVGNVTVEVDEVYVRN